MQGQPLRRKPDSLSAGPHPGRRDPGGMDGCPSGRRTLPGQLRKDRRQRRPEAGGRRQRAIRAASPLVRSGRRAAGHRAQGGLSQARRCLGIRAARPARRSAGTVAFIFPRRNTGAVRAGVQPRHLEHGFRCPVRARVSASFFEEDRDWRELPLRRPIPGTGPLPMGKPEPYHPG